MGHPKFSRPKYDTPTHPWKEARITEEHAIQRNHGLKSMKEIWKAKSKLRRYRQQAMKLIGRVDLSETHWAREEQDLLQSLHRRGLIEATATLDDVLALDVENILNRRLQAQVYYKGLASTISEARQLVTHGHIVIGDQKVTIPSYFVQRDEEELIAYHRDSALQDENHRIRRSIDTRRRDIADSGSEEEAKVATQPYGKEDVQQITEDAAAAPSGEDTIPEGEA